jgi:2-amino-4-hydroxy-6-hydroxymethyldihydropteridine diphosphokinase
VTRVFLGLGANVGNRTRNLLLALRLLEPQCRIVAVSSLYRSEAVVLEGQAPGPDYENAVCEVETELPPQDLLALAKEIEHEIGRRPAPRWAPRPIDIDVLLYGDEVVDTPELVVPHPLLHKRGFVLAPLAELAPEARHPVLERSIGEIAEDADFAGLTHLAAWNATSGAWEAEEIDDGEATEQDAAPLPD